MWLGVRRDSCSQAQLSLANTFNMQKSATLKWDKKCCLLSQISVWEKFRLLVMFGYLLRAREKTCERAAARALSTGALAAVQPRKWAPLELTLSNENKHIHRHTRWAKKALTTTQHSSMLRAAGQLARFAVPAAPTPVRVANMMGEFARGSVLLHLRTGII